MPSGGPKKTVTEEKPVVPTAEPVEATLPVVAIAQPEPVPAEAIPAVVPTPTEVPPETVPAPAKPEPAVVVATAEQEAAIKKAIEASLRKYIQDTTVILPTVSDDTLSLYRGLMDYSKDRPGMHAFWMALQKAMVAYYNRKAELSDVQDTCECQADQDSGTGT